MRTPVAEDIQQESLYGRPSVTARTVILKPMLKPMLNDASNRESNLLDGPIYSVNSIYFARFNIKSIRRSSLTAEIVISLTASVLHASPFDFPSGWSIHTMQLMQSPFQQ